MLYIYKRQLIDIAKAIVIYLMKLKHDEFHLLNHIKKTYNHKYKKKVI